MKGDGAWMEMRILWSDWDTGWGKLWPEVLSLSPASLLFLQAEFRDCRYSFYSLGPDARPNLELQNWDSLLRKIFCVNPWESGSLSQCSPPLSFFPSPHFISLSPCLTPISFPPLHPPLPSLASSLPLLSLPSTPINRPVALLPLFCLCP